MMKNYILTAVLSIFLLSCNSEPQTINYGSDACHYCDMTIVDRQHAAQIVTVKGKAYKFDAIECMIHSLQDEFKNLEMAHYLVTDFKTPEVLIDASKASFLISDNLKSPMGANLSAFENVIIAKEAQEKFTGKLYSWQDIQNHIKIHQ